jgi:hypothetical protein
MADDATQAAPPSPTFLQQIGAAWKGFKDKIIGYIPQIPKALVMSAIFMGGLMLLGPHLPKSVDSLLGASSLSNPMTFASRLGVGIALSAVISGIFGAAEEVHKINTEAPAPTPQLASKREGSAPSQQNNLQLTKVVPPAGLPPIPRQAQTFIG